MAAVHSVTLDGLKGRIVEVEVDISSGMPATVLVGLADTMVNEARDRVRAAVVNSGTSWPDQRVTINLAPSTLPKTGSHYDLAIGLATFAAKDLISDSALSDSVFLGELALDGRLRAIRGILPATLAAMHAGFSKVFVPEVNVPEAELVDGICVVGVRSLRQTVALLTGQEEPDEPPVPPLEAAGGAEAWRGIFDTSHLDMADVVGQDDASTAIVVAAAGGHHMLMSGPPGVGKTMLAQRLPSLLPPLDHDAALEVSAIHSLAGVLAADQPLIRHAPFVDPHHTASAVAIVGGGSRGIKPGALSLAHRGVLFLDEAPEFASNVLNALRQPLESGHVVVSRSAQTARFPARFQLILAANPCPCGRGGVIAETCECTPVMARRYRDRISGPIRDRIDIHRTLTSPGRPGLAHNVADPIASSAELAIVVANAQQRQIRRYHGTPWRLNADVPGVELRKRWPLDDASRRVIDRQLSAQRLSPRAADRVLRVAWSVADVLQHDVPTPEDVEFAVLLRGDMTLPPLLQPVIRSAA